MEEDLVVQSDVVIPQSELMFAASRSGGAGGQHVNKTSTRITVRWNVAESQALTDAQKAQIFKKLAHRLTQAGELVVHSGGSRSQHKNRIDALQVLVNLVRQGLYVPKKRLKTKLPAAAKEARLQAKRQRGLIKKRRQHFGREED